MTVASDAFTRHFMGWPSSADPSIPYAELRPGLLPYFPEWQNAFVLPQKLPRTGRHIFKVSLGKVWRRIAVEAEATLWDFSRLILTSVDFDDDHLDRFTYVNEQGRCIDVLHPYCQDGDRFTDEVTIGSLPLSEGSTMQYLFDFGDCWQFEVRLEAIEDSISAPSTPKTKKRRLTQPSPGEILESRGAAPPQYPAVDEENW